MTDGDHPRLRGVFPSTHWSEVRRAAISKEFGLETLLQRYLPPMRAYIAASCRVPPDRVEDLLQSFVEKQIIAGDLVSRADARRGRFRTLLRTALSRFVGKAVRDAQRQCRDARMTVPLDPNSSALGVDGSAGHAFDIAWAREVLSETARRMRGVCRAKGRDDVWMVFESRLLRPILDGVPPVSYDVLARECNLASPRAARDLLVTARGLYVRCLESVIGEYVEGRAAVAAEIAGLKAVLGHAQDPGGG